MEKYMMVLATALIAVVAFAPMFASAYRGNIDEKGPFADEDRCVALHDALAAKDYATWRDIKAQPARQSRLLDTVNEENFELVVQMHDAMKSGDYATVENIRSELGLHNGFGPRDGLGIGKHMRQGSMVGIGIGNGGERQHKNR